MRHHSTKEIRFRPPAAPPSVQRTPEAHRRGGMSRQPERVGCPAGVCKAQHKMQQRRPSPPLLHTGCCICCTACCIAVGNMSECDANATLKLSPLTQIHSWATAACWPSSSCAAARTRCRRGSSLLLPHAACKCTECCTRQRLSMQAQALGAALRHFILPLWALTRPLHRRPGSCALQRCYEADVPRRRGLSELSPSALASCCIWCAASQMRSSAGADALREALAASSCASFSTLLAPAGSGSCVGTRGRRRRT